MQQLGPLVMLLTLENLSSAFSWLQHLPTLALFLRARPMIHDQKDSPSVLCIPQLSARIHWREAIGQGWLGQVSLLSYEVALSPHFSSFFMMWYLYGSLALGLVTHFRSNIKSCPHLIHLPIKDQIEGSPWFISQVVLLSLMSIFSMLLFLPFFFSLKIYLPVWKRCVFFKEKQENTKKQKAKNYTMTYNPKMTKINIFVF